MALSDSLSSLTPGIPDPNVFYLLFEGSVLFDDARRVFRAIKEDDTRFNEIGGIRFDAIRGTAREHYTALVVPERPLVLLRSLSPYERVHQFLISYDFEQVSPNEVLDEFSLLLRIATQGGTEGIRSVVGLQSPLLQEARVL